MPGPDVGPNSYLVPRPPRMLALTFQSLDAGGVRGADYVLDGQSLGAGEAGFGRLLEVMEALPEYTAVVDISRPGGMHATSSEWIGDDLDYPYRGARDRLWKVVAPHRLRFIMPDRVGWMLNDGSGYGLHPLGQEDIREYVFPLLEKHQVPWPRPS